MRAAEMRGGEVRAAEVRAGEDRVVEIRAREVRAAEVRAAEVRAIEVRTAEVRVGEVCPGQVEWARVTLQIAAHENGQRCLHVGPCCTKRSLASRLTGWPLLAGVLADEGSPWRGCSATSA